MKHLLYFVVIAATMMLLSQNLPDMFYVSGWQAALIAAVVLAVVNTILKPILFLLTLPFTIVTLGLFLIVLNVAMLKLTDMLVPGFDIKTLPALVLGTVVLSVVGMLFNAIMKDSKNKKSKAAA